MRRCGRRWGLVLLCAGAPWGAPAAEEIAVAVFVPAQGEQAALGRMVQRGVEMGIADVNAGRAGAAPRLRLVVARADQPWNAGARELARAVYEEDAWVVVGGLDDRGAHVAQQVVTRARGKTLLLTPWAADPSLAQVRIPWFFRLVPDDRAQAAALAGALFVGSAERHVALLVDGSGAARRAAEAFRRAAPAGAVLLLEAGGGRSDGGALAARLNRSAAQAVGLYLEPNAAAAAARQLRSAGVRLPLFGSLAMVQGAFMERAGDAAEGMLVAAPEGAGSSGRANEFSRRFADRYGEGPAPAALYARDAVFALAAALRRCGGRRSDLAAALSATSIEGVTGRVRFGPGGERLGGVAPARIVGRRLEGN